MTSEQLVIGLIVLAVFAALPISTKPARANGETEPQEEIGKGTALGRFLTGH